MARKDQFEKQSRRRLRPTRGGSEIIGVPHRTSSRGPGDLVARPYLLDAVVGLVGLGMAALAVATAALEVQLSPVLTGSMRGTFDAGALLVSRPVPAGEVRPGDVVVFTAPGTSDRYAHRVVDVERADAGPIITTRGDANPVADPWRAQLAEPEVPRVVGSLPHAGRLVVAGSDPATRAGLLALAGLLFAATGVRALLGPRPSAVPPSAPEQPVPTSLRSPS